MLAEHLTPAGTGHPWTGATFSSAWGTRDVLDTALVRPDLVAEISADTSVDRAGQRRGRQVQQAVVEVEGPFGLCDQRLELGQG
ncbi:hypothetical protein [Streptomyces sp. CB00455]|uniref:hypothetical protein n=1 Tax=Streptomyces sp. CB00455 TaxID=1703927 RepID=UPI00093A9B18|nr:hypothetical protein [Streptomyces sp. CB00455]